MRDNELNITEVAILAGSSRSDVKAVKEGKQISNIEKAKKINEFLQFEKHLLELFLHDEFFNMCEIAISKARKTSTRKFAVFCQNASETMRYKLNITDEDRNESKG